MIGHRIHFEFDIGESGSSREMRLVQLVPMPRKSDLEEPGDEAPEYVMPCLGKYTFVQANVDFTVFYRDDRLLVHDPMDGSNVGLNPTGEEDLWIDEYGKNKIEFEKDEDGNVTTMVIHSINRFVREE